MRTAPVTLCCSYAYLECANEKSAYEMSEKYKDTEIGGEKVYVIQAISEKKDKFGQWHYILKYNLFQKCTYIILLRGIYIAQVRKGHKCTNNNFTYFSECSVHGVCGI